MSTNYYFERACGDCGHITRYHIGKSSGGWCFGLHVGTEVQPLEVELEVRQKYKPVTVDIRDWHDWQRAIAKGAEFGWRIVDEYGRVLTVEEMAVIVTDRSWPRSPDAHSLFDFERNKAELGPNGLVRSKVDGWHCVGHGDGTWDLIVGEFS